MLSHAFGEPAVLLSWLPQAAAASSLHDIACLIDMQGVDRALTRYKVECTGALFSASMPLPATSHVITTAAACEQPSDKIIMAAK